MRFLLNPTRIITRTYNVKHLSTVAVQEPQECESLLIKCKRTELNQWSSDRVHSTKFEATKLASKGWLHKKSRGDYFVIFPKKRPRDALFARDGFQTIGVSSEIVHVLNNLEIRSPTKVQCEAIPTILKGKNTLIAAETGCGKTYAYLIPLIQQILNLKQSHAIQSRRLNSPLGVVLLPSRELAEQIGDVALQFARDLNIHSKVVVGGHTKRKMMNPEMNEVDLLVASLGSISKLTTTGVYRMTHAHHVVLDEADTLLDASFSDKLQHLLGKFKISYSGFNVENESDTQLTLASATLPQNTNEVLQDIIPSDSLHVITSEKLHHVLDHVPQHFYRVGKSEKPIELLKRVKEDCRKNRPVIIFSNKSATCDYVSLFLKENNVECVNVNGEMHPDMRMGRFKRFQNGEINVISCTDIGSRGLDTVRVQHVINYDFPLYTADYLHRCGRTGRVGSSNNCTITNLIASDKDVKMAQKIEFAVRTKQPLPNVDGNITKLITNKIMRELKAYETVGRLN